MAQTNFIIKPIIMMLADRCVGIIVSREGHGNLQFYVLAFS